jgi:TRAP-type C4-dicarboxylate transport system permease small subunit
MKEDWLNFIPGWLFRAAQFLGDVGAIALFAMMMLTIVDIVGRNLGLGSIEPIVELSSYGVVIAASFGLAVITALGDHIIIDLFTRNNRRRTNRIIDAFWQGVTVIVLVTMAWLAVKEGFTLHETGTRSELLEWSPLVPHLPAAFGWLVAATVSGWIAVMAVKRIFVTRDYDEAEDRLDPDQARE